MLGYGTNKDEKKALDMYIKASEQGNGLADDRFCDIYRFEIGTGVNIDKAIMYNSKTRNNENLNSEIKYLSLLKQKNK